jgi:hypothetical protein
MDLRGRKWWEAEEDWTGGLYASPSFIRVTKSRKMRCIGHVACI